MLQAYPMPFATLSPSIPHSRSFFFGEADFFFAKRLFFRAARDVSGAHCVPPWARVEIKLKMSFQALSHSSAHERASALTSPPPTFCSLPYHQAHHPPNPSSHPKKRNIPYWYCLQCTPSLTLPPSSLKCLQKSNPNIHRKCFRCFKCFGCFRCFMFAFGPQNRPFLVQIRTNPKKSVPTHLRHIMGAENTQKGNSPTGLRTRFSHVCYRRKVVLAKPTFCSLPSHWILQNIKTDTYSFDGVE